MADDNAAEAAQILHEDRISDTVAAARKALDGKRWVLFHAKDYLLGVLQLLESRNLLRDHAQEEKEAEQRRADNRSFARAYTERERAMRQLMSQVVGWCGLPGVHERMQLIEDARDDTQYQELTRRFESDELPGLVRQWREERQETAEEKLARVRKLLRTDRKTLSVQALRDALNEAEGCEARDAT